MLNYTQIGSDVGLTGKTVKEYYQILSDSLIGYFLEPWFHRQSRKEVTSAKFYLFDPGVTLRLLDAQGVDHQSKNFGQIFESFIINEVRAYLSYNRCHLSLSYWRNHYGDEVDLMIGDQVAVEIKASKKVSNRDIKGLCKLQEQRAFSKRIIVSQDPLLREDREGVIYMPWEHFFLQLWEHQLLGRRLP